MTVADTFSREALHLQVAGHYRRLIRSGSLRPGDRLPPLRKIAADLGVSVTPIHTAFDQLEREGLLSRRHGVGVFVGGPVIPASATLEVGIVFRPVFGWEEDDNYGLRLFRGIQEVLRQGKHRTSLVTVARRQCHFDEVAAQFQHRPPHAYLLDEHIPDAVVECLAASGRPVVVVNRGCAVPGVSAVHRDNRQAGAEVARRMLEHGHTVVGCVTTVGWNETEAVNAFLEVMAEAGATVPASRLAAYDSFVGSGGPGFNRVMASFPVPTAVYCPSDRTARNACRWAREGGLRVPDDLSVVGTLDLRLAEALEPPLTTFRFDPERIGRAAVSEAIALCREPGRTPGDTAIPGEWVERASLARVRE